MKAKQGEFEALAPFYWVCNRRASHDQTVSLYAVQLFQLLELLDKGLFVLAWHLRSKFKHYCIRPVLACDVLEALEHTHMYYSHFGSRNWYLEYAVELDVLRL